MSAVQIGRTVMISTTNSYYHHKFSRFFQAAVKVADCWQLYYVWVCFKF